mgnify:CR=1 FL=1
MQVYKGISMVNDIVSNAILNKSFPPLGFGKCLKLCDVVNVSLRTEQQKHRNRKLL